MISYLINPRTAMVTRGSTPQQFLIKTTHIMTTAQFSEEAKQTLIGRMIIEVGNNYIVLDNGLRIYLADEEIQMLS